MIFIGMSVASKLSVTTHAVNRCWEGLRCEGTPGWTVRWQSRHREAAEWPQESWILICIGLLNPSYSLRCVTMATEEDRVRDSFPFFPFYLLFQITVDRISACTYYRGNIHICKESYRSPQLGRETKFPTGDRSMAAYPVLFNCEALLHLRHQPAVFSIF